MFKVTWIINIFLTFSIQTLGLAFPKNKLLFTRCIDLFLWKSTEKSLRSCKYLFAKCSRKKICGQYLERMWEYTGYTQFIYHKILIGGKSLLSIYFPKFLNNFLKFFLSQISENISFSRLQSSVLSA